MARADHTIHNRDTLEELDRKVRLLAKQLHLS
jgi:hypothetical protein